MSLLEEVKQIVEKATGWRRPDDPTSLLRERKPHTYRFMDDGLIPNHPRWPFVIYKSAVRLPDSLDPDTGDSANADEPEEPDVVDDGTPTDGAPRAR